MFFHILAVLAAAASVKSAAVEKRQATSSVPQYFQTTPELFAGEFCGARRTSEINHI